MVKVISRLNPITKLLAIISIIAIIGYTKNLVFSYYMLGFTLLISSIEREARSYLIKLLSLFWPFIAGFTLFNMLLFSRIGEPMFNLGPISLSSSGLHEGALIGARITLAIVTAAIFAGTTDPGDFGLSLSQNLKLPQALSFSIFIAYNIFYFLINIYREIVQALKSRWIIRRENQAPFKSLTIIRVIMANVNRRIESTAISMELRAFGYGKRSHWRSIRFSMLDFTFLFIVSLSIILGITIFSL